MSVPIKGLFACLLFLLVPASSGFADYCFEQAEGAYGISSQILWSISKQESGHKPNAINRNTNGTYDFCHMQINSGWYRTLGPERWARLSDPCYCTMVGAWILSNCIQRHGYTWEAIGCYHSPKKARGIAYARKINGILSGIAQIGYPRSEVSQ